MTVLNRVFLNCIDVETFVNCSSKWINPCSTGNWKKVSRSVLFNNMLGTDVKDMWETHDSAIIGIKVRAYTSNPANFCIMMLLFATLSSVKCLTCKCSATVTNAGAQQDNLLCGECLLEQAAWRSSPPSIRQYGYQRHGERRWELFWVSTLMCQNLYWSSEQWAPGPHVFIWPYVSGVGYFALRVLKYNAVSQLGIIYSTTLDETLAARSWFRIWKYFLHISMISSHVFVHLGISAFQRSFQSRSRSQQNSGHLITLMDCDCDD